MENLNSKPENHLLIQLRAIRKILSLELQGEADPQIREKLQDKIAEVNEAIRTGNAKGLFNLDEI